MKNILLIILLFVVVGFGWHFYGATFEERVDIGEVIEAPILFGKDALLVEDQESDGRIMISRVTLSKRAFVVIQDDEGGPGKVIGTSGLLEPGRLKDLSIDLDAGTDSGYAFASLYQDEGDGSFNIEADIPIRGPSLAPVQQRFLIALPSLEPTNPAGIQE